MATRKDQLDAFNFARRRMVANLVVPTATGSDEGAPRPVKTFATSIILSAIAVAAVAVIGVFKPAAPSGWQSGLAVDESTGAAYIYTKSNNQLHSVYNITSARLILGSNFAKYDVPDSTINSSGITIGAPVGILGAPEDVPSASSMTLTQWSLCQNEKNPSDQTQPGGATYLQVGYGPSEQTPTWTTNSHQGLIVHDSQNEVYLIAGDYKYDIGNSDQEPTTVTDLLTGLNLDQSWTGGDGFWVSDAWLSVFSPGDRITFPTLAGGFGEAVTDSHAVSGHVGDNGANPGGGGSVQTDDGLLELNPFAYDLFLENPTVHNATAIDSSNLTPSDIANANPHGNPNPSTEFKADTYGSTWPTASLSLTGTDTTQGDTQNLCVGYDGTYDDGSSVPHLTTWTSATLPYGGVGGQFGLDQSGANNEANNVLVRPGYGLVALRINGNYGSGGQEYLIEDSDYRYALVTVQNAATSGSQASTSSAKTLLGYQGVNDEQVPNAWVNLIQGGATLNPTSAGMTPGSGQ
ncbi:type VII secretion protein EccB [Actinospica durhamensis]|uniref:Type VII secretion protein EccB n=1 Tax=Actinospica durhamensis TaxID=1508375 RepID=A0A941EYE1_9ACTN|nr:type VII secretion protein EccB [Actinospica durhamensis]MBR7837324.1 type VII secretion protein EccB [Actinospica durhamensis]